MRFGSAGSNNAAAKNFGDNLSRFAGTVDTVVGELIRREALRVERAKGGFVAEEGPAGHSHAAGEEEFHGRIQPEYGDAGGAQKFRAARLRVSAATKREDSAFLKLGSAAERGAELVRFNLAECRLAKAFEDLRDGQAGGLLDAIIEIDKAPGELPS
jgi:hypothetical protein